MLRENVSCKSSHDAVFLIYSNPEDVFMQIGMSQNPCSFYGLGFWLGSVNFPKGSGF